jgi:hypothetical protein
MSHCAYCKKQGADQKTAVRLYNNGRLETMELSYCSPECKEKIHSFTLFHNRFAPKFMLFAFGFLMLVMVIPLLLKGITGNPFFMVVIPPVVLALMGVLLIAYPLGIVTTRYYKNLGIKYTNLFIRLTGVLLIASGASLLWFR